MQITLEFLKEKKACSSGIEEFKRLGVTDLRDLILKCDEFSYSNWLLTKIFTKEECVKYAIFAAKKVLNIFELKYPKDKRPRKAIESAEYYLNNPNAADAANAAYHAADAAYHAANTAAVYTAYTAANAAANTAANAAANTDVAAADAAYHAADAACHAADAAAYHTDAAASNTTKKEILQYGLELIYERKQ